MTGLDFLFVAGFVCTPLFGIFYLYSCECDAKGIYIRSMIITFVLFAQVFLHRLLS